MLRSELEATGALVYLNQTEDGLGCVLSAQLSRLLKSKLAIMKNFQFYLLSFFLATYDLILQYYSKGS